MIYIRSFSFSALFGKLDTREMLFSLKLNVNADCKNFFVHSVFYYVFVLTCLVGFGVDFVKLDVHILYLFCELDFVVYEKRFGYVRNVLSFLKKTCFRLETTCQRYAQKCQCKNCRNSFSVHKIHLLKSL